MIQGRGSRAFSYCRLPRTPHDVVRNAPNNGLVQPTSTNVRCPVKPVPQPLGSATHRIDLSRRPLFFIALCLLLLFGQMVDASYVYELGTLEAFPGELLFEIGEPPVPRMVLEARQESASILPSSTVADGSAANSPTSTASGVIETAPPVNVATLPQPFDSSIGNNFTSSTCPQFFNRFLGDSTFQQCLPLSLLLQTSTGFFSATRSPIHLTQVVSTSCAVNYTACSTLMASLAREIQTPSACGEDLAMRNPVVTQAYAGFVAYAPLYHAGCLSSDLVSSTGGGYCIVDALTNASAPASAYVYYLPLGVSLPSSARPACSPCLQETMAVFAEAAVNRSVPLSADYLAAAQQVDLGCGADFVQASKAEMATSSAASTARAGPGTGFVGGWTLFVVMFVMIMDWVL